MYDLLISMYKLMKLFALCVALSLVAMSGCIEDDSNMLSIGETGTTEDDIEITVMEYKLIDSFDNMNAFNKPIHYYPPEGAQFLLVYLKVTNIGTSKTPSGVISVQRDPIGSSDPDTPILTYSGNEIKANSNIITYRSSDSYSDKIYSVASTNTQDIFLIIGDGYDPKFRGYGNIYPDVTKEGWIAFSVPKNINLSETDIEVHGLTWTL